MNNTHKQHVIPLTQSESVVRDGNISEVELKTPNKLFYHLMMHERSKLVSDTINLRATTHKLNDNSLKAFTKN